MIAANLLEITHRMAAACQRAGRDSAAVRLLAVSKTQPAAAVNAALAAGQRLFGENRVQELRDKAPLAPGAEWHLIGPLQGNKVKQAVELCRMIHSVDSLSLATDLARRAVELQRAPLPVLMQVNVGLEPQKHGVEPTRAAELARAMGQLPGLQLCGLMAIPPYLADPQQVRPYFRQLAALARRIEALALPNVTMGELSMGMSHDYEVAIEEGATLVRVGSALFGARSPGD